MKKLSIMMCVVVALVAASCGDSLSENAAEEILERSLENEGGGDVDVDIDEDDGSVSINVEGEDGGSFSFGNAELPENMMTPVPSGGDVLTAIVSGDDIAVSLTYPAAEFDSIVQFYQDWADGEGVEYTSNSSTFESADGVTIRTMSMFVEDTETGINITDCPSIDNDDAYNVCVSIGESTGG